MAMGGGFVAGSIVGKMMLDTTKWSKSVGKVKADQKSMGGMSDKMAGRFKSAGRAMTVAGAAITASFGAMVGAAIKLNSEMANVATLIPESRERLDSLKTTVQDLAIATGKGTSDITGGLYQVISAFGDGADTAKILDINVRAAAAGMATTTDAINLTSAVMKGYGTVNAEATQKAADLAFMTVKLGQTTFPELAQSMGMSIPIAAALNVKQEELFASYATLTGVTGDAAKVSTQMRGVMTAMMKPSEDMSAAIRQIGYETAEAMIAELGLVGSMRALVGTTDGTTESVGKLFRNVRALPAVFALTGGQAEVFDEKLTKINDSAGAMDTAFEAMTQGINKAGFDMSRLKQMTVVLAQRLGDNLAPVLGKLVVDIGKVVNKVTEWIKEHPKLTNIIVKAVAGFGALMLALGPFVMIIPKIVLGVSKIAGVVKGAVVALKAFKLATIAAAGPVVILTGALAALAIGYLKVKKARDAANEAADRELGQFKQLSRKLKQATDAVGMHTLEFHKMLDKYKQSPTAMAMAIKKGKEGKELQEALAKVTTESKEAYEAATTATIDLGDAFDENLNPPLREAIKETQSFTDYLKDIGIKTIGEKKDRIAELESHLEDLRDAYDRGELTMIDYMNAVKQTRDEISGLSTVVEEEALPAARSFGDVVAKAPDKFKDAVPKFEKEAKKLPSIFGQVSERIRDQWTTGLADMLKGAKSFKDVLKGIWGTIKDQVFTLVAQIVSKWTLGLIGKLAGGAGAGGLLDGLLSPFKKAAGALTGAESGSGEGGIFGNMGGSFLGNIAKMAGPIGIGLLVGKMIGFERISKTLQGIWDGLSDIAIGALNAIGDQLEAIGQIGVKVFEGIGNVASSALGAVSDIVGGLGKAIGGILSGIGGLFKKKKTPETEWLQKIYDTNQGILGTLRIDMRDRQFNWMLDKQQQQINHLEGIRNILNNRFNGTIRAVIDSLQRTADNVVGTRQLTGHILNHTKTYLKQIAENTERTYKEIKKVGGAQAGAVLTEPKLMMTHGTPASPEYILRENQLAPAAAAVGGGVTVHNHVHMNGTMISDRDYARNRLIPEMLSALEAHYKKSDFKRLLGI